MPEIPDAVQRDLEWPYFRLMRRLYADSPPAGTERALELSSVASLASEGAKWSHSF